MYMTFVYQKGLWNDGKLLMDFAGKYLVAMGEQLRQFFRGQNAYGSDISWAMGRDRMSRGLGKRKEPAGGVDAVKDIGKQKRGIMKGFII